jgi:hypothetical protein
MNASSKLLSRLMWAVLVTSAVGCMGPEEVVAEQGVEEVGQVEARVWTGWTSEEFQPVKCVSGRLVSGVACQGRYCDNISIHCDLASGTYYASSWTPYFSEEAPNRYFCGSSGWMTGIGCRGSYCDNITFECTEVLGRTVGACYWSGYYSEEQSAFMAPAGHFIRGIECTGSNCDNKRYYYCQLR